MQNVFWALLDTGKLHGSWKSHVKLFLRENSKSFHTLYIKFLSRVLQTFVESDEEREEKDPDWAPTPRPIRKKKGKGISAEQVRQKLNHKELTQRRL